MSCGATKNTSKSIDNTNITFKILQQGSLHGNGEEAIEKSEMLIKDAKTWENLLRKMRTTNHLPEKLLNTKIDFSKENIIAVFMPVLGAGGSSVEIEKITSNDNNIVVKVNYISKSGLSIAVMNQPYIIVKIPAQDKEIVFNIQK